VVDLVVKDVDGQWRDRSWIPGHGKKSFSSPKRPDPPRGPPSLVFIGHSVGSFSGEGGLSMNLTTHLI